MDPHYVNPDNLKHRSDSVTWNGTVFLSGVMPSDPKVDVADQTRQVLARIDALLAQAGTDKSRLLSATIWMADVNRDVAAFNAVWNAWVVPGRQPVRACVQAALQGTGLLEVSVIAAAR